MGHQERLVPIDLRLMRVLQEAFDEAEPGTDRLLTMNHGGQSHRALKRIVANAGIEPWDDAFQTLRRSCEKEWAMTYPQFAVSKWIGHSIIVSGRHYANAVPDELFDRAAGIAPSAAQNAAQHPAASGRTESQDEEASELRASKNPARCGALRRNATRCANRKKWSRGDSNPRAGAVSR